MSRYGWACARDRAARVRRAPWHWLPACGQRLAGPRRFRAPYVFQSRSLSLSQMKLGDKIIGIAAIERAREFDDTIVGEIGDAFGEQGRASLRHCEKIGIRFAERHCMETLQSTHRPVAALGESGIEGRLDGLGIGQQA